MSKAENKTQVTDDSVEAFLAGIADEQRQRDARELLALMQRVTGKPAAMWGPSVIGFGSYRYRYDSGREGEFCAVGFSPRKDSLSVYLIDGASRQTELLSRLGPYKTGKSCLYIKRLSDVDIAMLEQMVRESYEYVMKHKDIEHSAK